MDSIDIVVRLTELRTKAEEISYSMIEAGVDEVMGLEIELANVEDEISRLEYELENHYNQDSLEEWSLLENG